MPAYALFGDPVAHSVSPAMQQAAFRAAGLTASYQAVRIAPAELPSAIARLRAGEWQGANVTIPHKQAVISLLDGLTETALTVGAVNTLFWADGQLIGDNTDVGGFLADLDTLRVDVRGQAAMVLGSGGSARAVTAGLLSRGVLVRLFSRNRPTAEHLAEMLTAHLGGAISVHDLTPLDLGQYADLSALVVNCTPLGMHPNIYTSPWPVVVPIPESLFVYDLVYNPSETALMRHATASKARAASGLGMLVQQGALAFQRWTGQPADVTAMHAAAETALKEHA